MSKKDIILQIKSYCEGIIGDCDEILYKSDPKNDEELEIMIRDDFSCLQGWIEQL